MALGRLLTLGSDPWSGNSICLRAARKTKTNKQGKITTRFEGVECKDEFREVKLNMPKKGERKSEAKL